MNNSAKILVIEDEESVRTSIDDLLSAKGYSVYQAGGGLEGIATAKRVIPDLIISDIMMADIDGYMVFEKLKEDIKTAHIPFLFLTAKADITELRKGMGLGVDDYLFKPFKAKDLLQVIQVRLNKYKDTENKFQLVWENSSQGFCLINSRGEYIMVNNAFCKMVEMTEDQLIGKQNAIIYEKFFSPLSFGEFDDEMSLEVTLWNRKKKWLEYKNSVMETSNGAKFIMSIVSDVTTKKNNEMELLNSLREKEVLLKEIHHRVKNNLQIISSLLSLQSNYLNDESSREIFIESQNRIRSMSLIHEKLYQTKDLSKVNFNEYINELINFLAITYNIESDKLVILLNIEDYYFHVDIAIPLGLILNELITNSIKHAFNDGVKGEIEITIRQKKETEFILNYRDNGKGMPEGFNMNSSNTLGFSLITNLVEQLDGEIAMFNNDGVNFTIMFNTSL